MRLTFHRTHFSPTALLELERERRYTEDHLVFHLFTSWNPPALPQVRDRIPVLWGWKKPGSAGLTCHPVQAYLSDLCWWLLQRLSQRLGVTLDTRVTAASWPSSHYMPRTLTHPTEEARVILGGLQKCGALTKITQWRRSPAGTKPVQPHPASSPLCEATTKTGTKIHVLLADSGCWGS